jgi:hypothetical protein
MANFRPGTLDRDATVLGGRIQKVSLTSPNQFIDISNTKILQLTSDTTVASDRPFSFTEGSYPGQELTIQMVGPGDNKCQLQTIAAAYIKINSVWTAAEYDQIKLNWNGFDWIEVSRGAGGAGGADILTLFATVPVTAAQLIASDITPVNLLPTPGVGNAYVLKSVNVKLRPGTPFTGGSDIDFRYITSGDNPISVPVGAMTTGTNRNEYRESILYTAGFDLTVANNSNIALITTGTAYTGGHDFEIDLTYNIYDIS